MIAVVDDKAERPVSIGSAAPAGGLRRFVNDDVAPRLGEAHSGAQARKPRSDDMDGPAAHRTP